MIRKWQSENTAPLLSLWLESTTEAHPFIEPGYWKENEAMVRDVYLPSAETWVWEQDGEPYGFISVMQSQFVGALFVAPSCIGKGIGRGGGGGGGEERSAQKKKQEKKKKKIKCVI